MDILDSRTRNITHLALNGLYERSKAIASNSANVLTPNYQRKDVAFEAQLQNIIQNEDEKERIREYNARLYMQNPTEALKYQDPAQIAFMRQNNFESFQPEIVEDMTDATTEDGNNVVLENEMMAAARTGTQYTILSTLMARSFDGLESVIKGQ